MEDSTDKLRSIRDDVVQCTQCDLYKTRKNPVIGSGDHNADIMFVGEAPGEQEDKLAVPFIGAAGKVLDKMLASIDLKRDDVYICNTIKCRPPNNADPTDEQKEECSSYLSRQIDAVQPKVIVCLGNHAAKSILTLFGQSDKIEPLSKMSGELIDIDAVYAEGLGLKVLVGGTKIMPLLHPAALLHNPPLGTKMRGDFKKLKAAIGS